MSILHILKVTDSWWKKSSWATGSICLCHSISNTVAFSQVMQKLLPQLQHPLILFFFSSPSSSGPATDRSQPFLSAQSLRRCQFKRREKKSCLESQTDIAIPRPGPAVQRPQPCPVRGSGCGKGWRPPLLPAQPSGRPFSPARRRGTYFKHATTRPEPTNP